jgi:hypothetical protein
VETSFANLTLHYMVKLLGATYSDVLGAIKALGLKGRRNDLKAPRVWTGAQFRQIKTYLGK